MTRPLPLAGGGNSAAGAKRKLPDAKPVPAFRILDASQSAGMRGDSNIETASLTVVIFCYRGPRLDAGRTHDVPS